MVSVHEGILSKREEAAFRVINRGNLRCRIWDKRLCQ